VGFVRERHARGSPGPDGEARGVDRGASGTLVLAFVAAALAVAELARQHPAAAARCSANWEWIPAGDLQVAVRASSSTSSRR